MVNTQAIESRRELNAIYEVSKTLATSLDVTKTFREALNYLLHAFDWRRAFVVLSEPEGRLNGLCAVGLTREEQQRLQFQTNEGIVGRVMRTGKDFSDVLTLLDSSSAIDALLQRNRVRGVIEGQGGSTLSMKYLRRTDDVQVGEQQPAAQGQRDAHGVEHPGRVHARQHAGVRDGQAVFPRRRP